MSWWIRVLLFFKRSTLSFDVETCSLNSGSFGGTAYWVRSKILFGKVYILETGSIPIYYGKTTGKWTSNLTQKQSLKRGL